MALRFNVKIGPWLADGEGSFVDKVSVEAPSAKLVRLAAHAHDAGIIEVTEGLDESEIQSQEAGEAAQAVSRGTWVPEVWNADGTATPGYWDGPWGVGNQAQWELEKAQQRLLSARWKNEQVKAGTDDFATMTVEESDERVRLAEENLAAVDADIQGRLKA